MKRTNFEIILSAGILGSIFLFFLLLKLAIFCGLVYVAVSIAKSVLGL